MGKLKVDDVTLEKMQEDIEAILPYYFNVYHTSLDSLTERQIHDIWFHVYMSLSYPDDNPSIRTIMRHNGERLLQLNPQRYDDNLYPCGTNDNTLFTALKQIIKNIKEKQNG